MKIILELNGTKYTVEGESSNFILLLNLLADDAGLKGEDDRIRLLNTEELRALESL